MADKLSQLTNANQTDKASLFSALQFLTNQFKMNTDGMLPARVVSYDRKQNVAIVKPVIHFMTLEDKEKERDPLTEINVLSIGGGGFHISFPLAVGDLGWIFASDRDLTKFKEELADGAPYQGNAKSFNSGLFIPDVFRQYTINDEDDGAMVIQTTDGSTRIAIIPGVVNITTPIEVVINTPVTRITQDFIVEGHSQFMGGVDADDGTSVNLPSGTNVDGVAVISHGHEQNGDSGRTSGGMLP